MLTYKKNINKSTGLSHSMEDYLEAIFFIESKKNFSRVKDIASFLNVKLPSVNRAIKDLEKKGLIDHEKYGYIKLTKKGNKIASKISMAHKMLYNFFIAVGCNEDKAFRYACFLEHIIDDADIHLLNTAAELLNNKKK